MSQILAIEVNDVTFEAVRQQAEKAGLPPSQWLARAVELQFQSSAKTAISPGDARQRFEQLIGAVDLGHPTGADNDEIDADLCSEYAATHERL